jgi:mRNA interferase HigB
LGGDCFFQHFRLPAANAGPAVYGERAGDQYHVPLSPHLISPSRYARNFRRTLREHIDSKAGHRDQKSLKNALDAWFAEVQKADWKNTGDVKRSYTWASIISSDRVVFDILTNRYRLVTTVDFEKGIVWIKWIGTHKEYDKIDVKKVKHARH